MLRTFSTVCFIFLVNATLFAQKSLKSYKYIIVPNQYEFQKTADQYQLNSLTKFLFEKEDFTVFLGNDSFPKELAENPCTALKAIVRNDSGMFSTKVTIDLLDCYNAVIYSSPEGRSKIKDYKKGYQDAIRDAFAGIQEYVNDSINSETTIPMVVSAPLKETIAEPVKVQTDSIPVEVAVKEEVVAAKSDIENTNATAAVTKAAATAAVVAIPVVVPKPAIKISEKETEEHTIEGTYFIDMWGKCVISKKGNGYKVVGGDEDFEFAEIYTTSKPTIFMVKKTGFNQTQLLELDANGNLKIDSNSGVKIYKRIN